MTNLEWATPEVLKAELHAHSSYYKYRMWKAQYPEVYDEFRALCRNLMKEKRKFGMWLVANKLRWDYFFKYETEFKISNDYTALITRELMLEMPELKQYCRIKQMK